MSPGVCNDYISFQFLLMRLVCLPFSHPGRWGMYLTSEVEGNWVGGPEIGISMLSVRLRENQCQGPGQGQGRDKGLPTMSHSQMKYGFPTRFTKVKHSSITLSMLKLRLWSPSVCALYGFLNCFKTQKTRQMLLLGPKTSAIFRSSFAQL